ncbi:DUF2178 domain-containing protein [Lactobacillus sp. XV13L]|nr:DUF2178 domain-containing protein [Lactobacillus sp. XV13L]
MNNFAKDMMWLVFIAITFIYIRYVSKTKNKEKNDERWQLIRAKSDSFTLKFILIVTVAMLMVASIVTPPQAVLYNVLLLYCETLPYGIFFLKLLSLKYYEKRL